MTTTPVFQLTAEWTEIAVGPCDWSVQTASSATAIVFAGTTIPNAGTSDGLIVGPQGATLPALASGDKGWARAQVAPTKLTVMRT